MSLRVGIVGLPNVGKSTLFNALLKKRVALSANYPFATIEPNTGVVAVPDERLEKLGKLVMDEEKMTQSPPLVPAVVEFVDIAGLVKGASMGAGLGNQFLSHIREVDAIIHVLRDFEDVNVVREGSENPKSDRETIETELQLADLQVLEKLVLTQEKEVRGSKDPLENEKLKILKQVQDDISAGRILGNYHIGDERLNEQSSSANKWFRSLPLLSIKPVLHVFNVDEGSYQHKLEHESAGNEIVISAKIEEELADLSDDEPEQYLSELGVKEPGLNRLIKKAYFLLGLVSFLTAGKKEVRAWTIKNGMKAPQAAGVIHTDFEKGFIRAQVIEYEKLIEAGSYSAAKQKGWIRTEGKDYEVKDGDVVEFLISS